MTALIPPYELLATGILAEAHWPLSSQGFCLWFTGLPSSGKSAAVCEARDEQRGFLDDKAP